MLRVSVDALLVQKVNSVCSFRSGLQSGDMGFIDEACIRFVPSRFACLDFRILSFPYIDY